MSSWIGTERPHVVTATLDGGGVNSLDEAALSGLDDLLDRVERDDDVRALVVTGAGPTFCIGLDIDLLGRAFDDHAYFLDVVRRFHATLRRIERLPAPVVAAVNGTTRAGGFELMLACDVVLVADEAKVADHHMHFGMLPGGGASARLPVRIGPQRARELLLTGGWLRGPEAVEAGLALRSVPGDEMTVAVEELTDRLVDKPRSALARLKQLLDDQQAPELDRGCRLELEHLERYLAEEPMAAEGYRAFVEKREPAWRSA